MRARNIKPGFFSNEVLGTLEPIICLTFSGLWCLADKHGILEDRPLRIKAELFPYRENLDINGYLTVLERSGFIARYQVDGKAYIEVLNFRKHQTPHHTEKPKGYPSNPLKEKAHRYETVSTPNNDGESQVPERSDSLIPDSLIPDSLIQDKAPVGASVKKPKVKKFPMPADFCITEEVRAWAAKKGHGRLEERFEHFVGAAKANGYVYADWNQAFMNAIRDNWAKLADLTPVAIPQRRQL